MFLTWISVALVAHGSPLSDFEDFEENERIRAEIREDDSEIRKLLRSKEYVPVPRRRRL